MTIIAYRSGVLVADSRCTYDTEEGGTRVFKCEKLFRKIISKPDGSSEEVVLATAGESYSGMVFVDWYGSGKEAPDSLIHGDADFTVLILRKDGLYEVDKWCRPIKVLDDFYAIGSGTKAALGAMHMGASALKAVEIACRIDPYCAGPFQTMRLSNAKVPKVRRDVTTQARTNRGRQAEVGVPLGENGPAIVLRDDGSGGAGAGSGSTPQYRPADPLPRAPLVSETLHHNVRTKRDAGARPLLEVANRVQRASQG